MSELLYIDGQLMDLGEKVDITLNYKSNMLTDLSSIVGNNSYTINLPKTMRNLSVVGCADVPGSMSSFPRVFHEARYFRNGVEIVKNGRAVLMGIGESIEVVLTWGGASALSKIVEDGKNLTELQGSDYVDWDRLIQESAYNGVDKILISRINFDAPKNDIPPHPSVRSSYIFDVLKDYYNLSVEFPTEREQFVNSLIFPLLTRNGGYANRVSNQGGFKDHEFYGGELLDKMGEDFDSIFEVKYGTGAQVGRILYYKVLQDCMVVVTPNFSSYYIGASVKYGSDSTMNNTAYFPYGIKKNEGSTAFPYVYTYSDPVEIDLKQGDMFSVQLMYPIIDNAKGTLYTFGAQPKEVKVGDKFPIIENLPKVKVIDFIKAIASMNGLFVIPSTDGNTIRFVPFDTFEDKSKALDWSDKVVPHSEQNVPVNVSYSLEGFARNNRMRYKEDESVATLADSNIIVDDMTLEYEREAVVLPFAPSDSTMGYAHIKIYESDSDGSAKLVKVEPRVLAETDINGYSAGTFNGLQWSTLIANYYKTYQNAVKSPVIIVERIRLDELSLRDLDMSVPVYLRQYGKYYAVVEVKAPSSGICEVKLLQL